MQLLPLNPKKLYELQKRLGIIKANPDYRYFQIDISKLELSKTVIYFKTAPGDQNVTVKWLADVSLDDLQDVPPATIDCYNSMVGAGEPVFNYQFAPHIVYKGSIDVSDAGIVSTKA